MISKEGICKQNSLCLKLQCYKTGMFKLNSIIYETFNDYKTDININK